MPKKGGKKKKKTAGLPEQFWTMMPPPGSFDHRTRQWISSDPDRSQRDLLETEVLKAASPPSIDAESVPPSISQKVSKVYGVEGPWLWPLAGTTKVRDAYQAALLREGGDSRPGTSRSHPATSLTSPRLEPEVFLPHTHDINIGEPVSPPPGQAIRMRTAGTQSQLGRTTPPFYAALGFSVEPDNADAPWWTHTGGGCSRPITSMTTVSPTENAHRTSISPPSRHIRNALLSQNSPGHHQQRMYGPPLIHAPRLLMRSSASAMSRPATGAGRESRATVSFSKD